MSVERLEKNVLITVSSGKRLQTLCAEGTAANVYEPKSFGS